MVRRFPSLILAVPVLAVLCLGDALVLHKSPMPVLPCGNPRGAVSRSGALVSLQAGKRVGLLHQSAAQGRLKLIRLFLKNGHPVDERDGEGRTPLHWAAAGGQLAAVIYLVGQGASVNARCDNGMTPVHGAVVNGRHEVLAYLINHGGSITVRSSQEETPLHLAAARGDRTAARLLLSRGAEVDACDFADRTPLIRAVQRGSLEVAGLLLSSGAGVNLSDNRGRTALHHAATLGLPSLAQLLLTRGAAIGVCDRKGETPLHLAAEGSVNGTGPDDGHSDVVALLIARGADINARDLEGRTPLYRAAAAGCPKTVELLLTAGADPSIGDTGGRTPLHAASGGGDAIPLEVATRLVEHGARVDAADQSSIQPAQLAAVNGDIALVLFFLRCGAKEPGCAFRRSVLFRRDICARSLAALVYSALMLQAALGVYLRLNSGHARSAGLCLTAGMAASIAAPAMLERLMPPDLFCLYAQAFPAGIAACLIVRRLGQVIRRHHPVSALTLLFVIAGGVIFPFAALFFTFSGILARAVWGSLAAGIAGGACLALHEQMIARQASNWNMAPVPTLYSPDQDAHPGGIIRSWFH